MCEARDVDGNLLNQYFSYGQADNGSNYFYTRDQLSSIREMTDDIGNVQAQYSYDPYGRVAQLQGSAQSDFQYAGYYFHHQSNLSLPLFRAYNANFGTWINRDPIGEQEGSVNLYCYAANDPISQTDQTGLKPVRKYLGPLSPQQCCALAADIVHKTTELQKEHAKYNPVTDAIGGVKYKHGVTKPYGHFKEISALTLGLAADLARYSQDCNGRGPLSGPELIEARNMRNLGYNLPTPPGQTPINPPLSNPRVGPIIWGLGGGMARLAPLIPEL
jgi:RHS repeat-associated protein